MLPTFQPRPSSRRSAWSLVELAVVLFIMGVLAAVTAPRYTATLARYRVEHAARRVAADLEQARTRARLQNLSLTIAFNLAGESYTVAGMRDLDSSRTTYMVNLAGPPYNCELASATFDADATPNAEDQNVTYSRWGIPDSAGSVFVRCGNLQREVRVRAVTGKLEIVE
ncbi:MAG: GspH/FimT family protein [Pirellulales bacterium]|nr:GspH/FimT family protein [Pirellulales bacterium]